MSLSPSPLRLDLPSQAATEALAGRIASWLRPGDAILLDGPIGAGKSTLVRALLRAITGDPGLEVPSPTFTLVQTYDAPGGLVAHHFDLWRLTDAASLAELGWEDALRDIVLVEWPGVLGDLRPKNALEITLAVTSETEREALLSGWPDRLAAVIGAVP